MLNAKSGVSAKETQHNTGVTYKTAYYACMRVRIGMLMDDTKLNGIIEMDESYFGGKERKQAISKKYLPFYMVEYEWKFNNRNFKGNELEKFLKNALNQEKELEHWKAENMQQVKDVAYGK